MELLEFTYQKPTKQFKVGDRIKFALFNKVYLGQVEAVSQDKRLSIKWDGYISVGTYFKL